MDTFTSVKEINEALNAVKEKADELTEAVVENNDVASEAVDQALETDAAIIENNETNAPAETGFMLPDQNTLIKTALIIGIAALGGILFANRKSVVSGVKKIVTSKPASFARKAMERDESESESKTSDLKDKLNGIIDKLDGLKRTFERITNFFSRKKD